MILHYCALFAGRGPVCLSRRTLPFQLVNDLSSQANYIHLFAKRQREKEVRAFQQEIADLKGKLEPFILDHA